jgi:hypothetical protein
MWFYFFNVIFFFHIVISFVVLVGTRDDRTSAYKDLGFGFQDLVFGSQDLRHLMLVDRCSVLCLSRHFSLRPVVTDRRTHVTPSLFSASSGHRQTHAHNKRNYIEDCVWHWWVFGRICNKLLVRFVDGSFFKELPLEHDPKHSSTGWTCPLTILGRGELYFILEDTSTHFEMPCTRWS